MLPHSARRVTSVTFFERSFFRREQFLSFLGCFLAVCGLRVFPNGRFATKSKERRNTKQRREKHQKLARIGEEQMNNSINTTSSSHDNDKQAQHHLFAELTENASIGKSNEAKLSALAMVANLIDEETSVYKEKTIVHPGLMTVLLQNAKLGETFDIKEQALAVLTFLLTWLAATGGPQIIVEHKMDKFDRLKLLHFWALVRNIWVFHSAREIKRISKNSALKKLPKDLTRLVFAMLEM
jgi:hypothetical protein